MFIHGLLCSHTGISVTIPTTHPCTWATAVLPSFTCLLSESLTAGKTWAGRCRPSSGRCWSFLSRRRKRSIPSSTSTKCPSNSNQPLLPLSHKKNCTWPQVAKLLLYFDPFLDLDMLQLIRLLEACASLFLCCFFSFFYTWLNTISTYPHHRRRTSTQPLVPSVSLNSERHKQRLQSAS